MKSMALHSLQRLCSGSVVTCGPTKRDLQLGIRLFHGRDQLDVAGEAGSAGEQHQELVLFADLDRLLRASTWCGGASSSREPSSIPAGYASHTGYQ